MSMTPEPMRVIFKHEDEAGGEPIGPVTVYTVAELADAEARGLIGVPYDPDRIVRWVTHSQAAALAAEYGVELEES